MNKMNCSAVFCTSVCLLSLLLMSGCADIPSEIRYEDNVKIYTSPQTGVRSISDKYEGVTAHYILRQGGVAATPQSEIIKAPPEKQKMDSPVLVIETTNVLFDFDKCIIKDRFVPELKKWVDYFNNNPEVSAEIYGHTDSIGTKEYNKNLSMKRAQAVVNFLVKSGIAAGRLSAKGFGEDVPAATNNTKEGRQKNRRVEAHF